MNARINNLQQSAALVAAMLFTFGLVTFSSVVAPVI